MRASSVDLEAQPGQPPGEWLRLMSDQRSYRCFRPGVVIVVSDQEWLRLISDQSSYRCFRSGVVIVVSDQEWLRLITDQ